VGVFQSDLAERSAQPLQLPRERPRALGPFAAPAGIPNLSVQKAQRQSYRRLTSLTLPLPCLHDPLEGIDLGGEFAGLGLGVDQLNDQPRAGEARMLLAGVLRVCLFFASPSAPAWNRGVIFLDITSPLLALLELDQLADRAVVAALDFEGLRKPKALVARPTPKRHRADFVAFGYQVVREVCSFVAHVTFSACSGEGVCVSESEGVRSETRRRLNGYFISALSSTVAPSDG
jgi:hypothetical protein